MRKIEISIILYIILLVPSVVLSEGVKGNIIEVSTQDGLVLRLTPEVRVGMAGVEVSAMPHAGGLLVRDAARQPRPNLLFNPGFEEGTAAWQSEAVNAIDVETSHNGRASLCLKGPEQTPGRIARIMSKDVPAKGRTDYVVNFWSYGRGLSHYDEAGNPIWDWIVYVVQTDKAGHKTASDFPVSFPQRATADFSWTLVQTSFRTHSRTEQVQICWEIVRGSGNLWIDDVCLSEVGSGPEITVGGQFRRSDGEIIQSAGLKEIGLTLEAKYRAEAGKIEVSVEVADTTGEDRAVQVGFRLPVDLTDWHWEEHLRFSQKIEADGKSYRKWFELGPGRWCNILPFSCITGKDCGLALGIPMDMPRIFRVSYEPEGLEIWFDLGLSQDTNLPGRANFTFVIYDYPAKWRLRAATQKYHALYPQFFIRRAKGVGMWNLGTWYDRLRNPEDFALRFGGYFPSWNTRNGMYNFLYTEPWGWWMPWKQVKPGEKVPRPSYEEFLVRLQQAAETDPKQMSWSYMLPIVSLSEMARAIQNSGVYNEQDKFVIPGGVHWNTYGGDIIHQYWFANPDPNIRPLPTRGSIAREIELEPRWRVAANFGLTLEGPTLDSLGGMPELENYRREHWKVTKQPLVFNPSTRRVCELYVFAAYDFVSILSADMRKQNRLMKANAFPYSYAFFAHLLDVAGHEGTCEQIREFGRERLDEGFSYLHMLTGTKPMSFYDYDWWKKSFSNQTREYRLRKCLFYGVFPGLPWQEAEAFDASEVLRPLCRKYLPAIEHVSEAGWRAITGAIVSDPEVMVERYGDGREKNLCFTVRNETSEQRMFTLTVYPDEVGLISVPANLIAMDIVTQNPIPLRRSGKEIIGELRLSAYDTIAISLGTSAQIAGYYLRVAAERLSKIRDIAAFNTEQPAPVHSTDLRNYGYIDKYNSRGTFHIEEDPIVVDRRGRPAIRMNNDAQGDLGIYYTAGDIQVRPGQEYELFVHYQMRSPQAPGQEFEALSVRVGFTDYWRMKVILQDARSLPVAPAGEWNLYRVRFSVPPESSYMFISFILKGSDTTVWLGNQVLAQADKADAAIDELEQAGSSDAWLAREVTPRIDALTQEIDSVAGMPTSQRVKTLHFGLVEVKNILLKRYLRTSYLRNMEAWQRLDDAVAYLALAQSVLETLSSSDRVSQQVLQK